MASRVIGIDMGSGALRAVELELSDPPVVQRFGQVSLPPGAMQDGEVVDVAAVTLALRRLWEQVGFSSKSVRVGFASARMIIRIIEMPRLPRDELISAVRLQLEDLVPLPSGETVFDVQAVDEADAIVKKARKRTDGGQLPQQLLLAAAHRNALQPLTEAVKAAGLKLEGIDVVPAALARALTSSQEDADAVDMIVSIGADTVVVVAARHGSPLFARTLTNISGRRVTERIAARLDLDYVEAERRKRWAVDDMNDALAAREAAGPSVEELIDEIRDSITYYSGNEGALPIRRVLLTGGGSQLSDIAEVLSERLGLPVEHADPFQHLELGHIGFPTEDLPFLTPYAATAVGVALDAGQGKAGRLDLRPAAKETRRTIDTRQLLIGGGVALLVVAVGAFYVQRRGEISDARAETEAIRQRFSEVQASIEAARASSTEADAAVQATPAAVAESVAGRDIDWLAVRMQLAALSAPLGVAVSTLQGGSTMPAPPTQADATGTTAVPEAPAGPIVGHVTVTATAANLNTIAAWIDAVTADQRFQSVWINGVSVGTRIDGTSVLQFTADMDLGSQNLVKRPYYASSNGVSP